MAAHDRPLGHKFCLDHLKEELTFICKTCGMLICNKCLASGHKKHDFDTIDDYADLKHRELQDFKHIAANTTIPRIENEAESADNEYDAVVQLIQRNIKISRDHVEYLRDLIAVHMSSIESEYNKILTRYKKHHLQYKSGTTDAIRILHQLIKESEDATKSKSNIQVVDVANDVALRKPSISRYQQPKVNDFVPGSESDKHIQAAFGYIQKNGSDFSSQEPCKTRMPKLMVRPVASILGDPRSIDRRKDGTLSFCYAGLPKLTNMTASGSGTSVHCDIPIWDIAIHPTTDQIYCIPLSGINVRSLNSDTGETMKLFDTKDDLNCIVVTQYNRLILGDANKPMVYIYAMNGNKLQKVECKGKPGSLSVCNSTGRVGIVYLNQKGCSVFDDKYRELYTSTLPCIDIEFNKYGNMLLGDYHNKCVYILDATTGEHGATITSGEIQGNIKCLVTHKNGDLVVATREPDCLLTIKF